MKTKKLLSMILTLCMLLSVVPMMGLTASAGNGGGVAQIYDVNGDFLSDGYGTLQAAIDAAESGQTVQMAQNIQENITISSDDNITLDLNGYVLQGDGVAPTFESPNHSVIFNYGTLTITDSNTYNQTHKFTPDSNGLWVLDEMNGTKTVTGGCITGGNGYKSESYIHGGGVYNVGTLTLSDGNIVGNSANQGGGVGAMSNKFTMTGGSIKGNKQGVYVQKDTTFEMTGGSIDNNYRTGAGGGVYVAGTFTMSGTARVSDNSATAFGGVSVSSIGTFNMLGGEVSGNKADSMSGVCNSGTMTVGGTAVISGNTLNNGTTCNLNIVSNKYIAISTKTPLATSANIGVTLSNAGQFTVTGNGTKSDEAYFFSDNTAYAVKFNSTGNYLELVTGYTVTCADCTNGSVSVNKSSTYEGGTVTVSATPDEGYLLEALTYNPIGYSATDIMTKKSFTMPESDVIVSATFAKAYDKDIALTYTKPITIGDTAKDIADKLSGYDSDIMTAKVEILSKDATDIITSLDKTDNEYLIAIFLFMKDKTEYLFKTTHVYNSDNSNSAYYDGDISVDDYSIYMSEGGTHIKDEDEDTISTPCNEDAAWIDDGLLIVHSITFPEEVASANYSASLTLNKNIDINFKMSNLGTDGKGTGFDNSKFTITVDDANWTNYTVSEGVLSGVLKAVEPKDIGKDLHIVITYDGVTVKDFTYSVSDYCNAVFNAQTADKVLVIPTGKYDTLAELCKALLNYGKWAEDYANEKANGVGNYTESTLNKNHEIDFSDYTITNAATRCFDGDSKASDVGAKLDLGSTVTLTFTLTGCSVKLTNSDKDTQNFFVLNGTGDDAKQINPNRVHISSSGTTQTVSIEMYAYQLANTYTLKLKDVSLSDFEITYGVYTYCNEAQDGDASDGFTDTLKTLCNALHKYSEAVQNCLLN